MKKGRKIIYILLLGLVVINILSMNYTKVFAEGENQQTEDWFDNVDFWKPITYRQDHNFNNKVNIIVTSVRTIGIMISVITLIVIGIKFMLGSVEEKAQYKQTLAPWLIGAILVFAITTIPTIIYELTVPQENQNPGGGGGGGGGGANREIFQ